MANQESARVMSAVDFFWMLTLCFFPITTPPFLMFGDAVAKPLAAIPAVLIILIVFCSGGYRFKYIYSRELKILYFFLIISILGYALSILVGALTVDVTRLLGFCRAIIALMMGVIFYLCFCMMNTNQKELRRTELIVLTAMSISVFVEILQYLSMNGFSKLSFIVDSINSIFVGVSPGAWIDRFHGLAYEPSWLASQLTLIMMPLTLSRIRANEALGFLSFGLFRVRLERLFFVVSLLGIVLAGSRTAFFCAITMLLISAFSNVNSAKKIILNALKFGIILFIITAASIRNDYVGDTIAAIIGNLDDPFEMLLSVSAVPRISNWVSAWFIFLQHPIFGVGLGNSTYFYAANVPDWALAFPEVQGWLSGSGTINPKNLFLKLLAETGLVGFLIFAIFVLKHFQGKNPGIRYRVLRNSGIIALFFNYFSLDSFALPTEWFLLGFIVVLGDSALPSKSTHDERKDLNEA